MSSRATFFLKRRGNSFCLSNRRLQLLLSRATGRVEKIFIKAKEPDLPPIWKEHSDLSPLERRAPRGFWRWNVISAWLEVLDELEGKTYRDGREAASVTYSVKSSPAEKVLRVKKHFRGASFIILETWSVRPDEIEWSVEVHLEKGEPSRSIQIRQFVPWPDQPYGWDIWTAQQHFPKLVANVGNTKMVYGDICFGMALPMLTVYNEKRDAGLSLAKPFGLKVPRWGASFDGYRDGGVTVEGIYLALRAGKPARVSLLLHADRGCWRPALGWLFRKYRDYFVPGNPASSDVVEGGFMIGSPFTTKAEALRAKKAGAKVVEVHYIFPYYGNYHPEEKEWPSIFCLEDQKEAKKHPKCSVDRIRKTIRMFRKLGIVPLPYIQLAGDGYEPVMRKKFPDSIYRNLSGRVSRSWCGCIMMNSDPKYSFGKDIERQLDRFFERYPEAGGLFWDQPCYDDIDSAHDDGVTMVENKPAYRLVFDYEKHAEKMMREVRKRNMFVFANGPVYIELCRGVDAIMAEGTSWTADVLQYMCIARPLLFYSYFGNEEELEEMFRKSIVVGGSCYSTPGKKLSGDMQRIYDAYRPLVDTLRGRRLLFDPNPLKLPLDIEGNIFRGRGGDVYVTLVTRRARLLDGGRSRKGLTFEVEFRGMQKVKRAFFRGTLFSGERPAHLRRRKGRLLVTISEHWSASVVRLETASTGRR